MKLIVCFLYLGLFSCVSQKDNFREGFSNNEVKYLKKKWFNCDIKEEIKVNINNYHIAINMVIEDKGVQNLYVYEVRKSVASLGMKLYFLKGEELYVAKCYDDTEKEKILKSFFSRNNNFTKEEIKEIRSLFMKSSYMYGNFRDI